MMNVQVDSSRKMEQSGQENANSDDIAKLFTLYVSNEPSSRLPFTGAAINVGRTSSVATTTCSKLF
jgi:hypothetical protein